MFKLIEFLKRRPSDMTIRIIRTLLSLMMATLLIYTNKNFILPLQSFYVEYASWIVYGLAAIFVVHALVFGVLGLCVYKRTTMKKIQMVCGLACVVIGTGISYDVPVPTTATEIPGSTVSLSEIVEKSTPDPINVGGWMILYGIFTLIAGISGKMITQKCSKHKEVITKIRV